MSDILASVTSGMAVFLLSHVAVWCAVPSNSPRIVLLGFLAALGVTVSLAMEVLLSGLNIFGLFAVLCIDSFAVVLYVFIYAAVARSVSITLLSRLRQSGSRPLELNLLVDEYVSSHRFHDRIQLMHNAQLVQLSGNVVALTRKGFTLARAARLLARVSGGDLHG